MGEFTGTSCEIALRWCHRKPLMIILVQVMAWCQTAPSHYRNQCCVEGSRRHMASLEPNESRWIPVHLHALCMLYEPFITTCQRRLCRWISAPKPNLEDLESKPILKLLRRHTIITFWYVSWYFMISSIFILASQGIHCHNTLCFLQTSSMAFPQSLLVTLTLYCVLDMRASLPLHPQGKSHDLVIMWPCIIYHSSCQDCYHMLSCRFWGKYMHCVRHNKRGAANLPGTNSISLEICTQFIFCLCNIHLCFFNSIKSGNLFRRFPAFCHIVGLSLVRLRFIT